MNVTTRIDNIADVEWRDLCADFSDHNIYQTWSFADLRAVDIGAEVSRMVVERDGRAIG